MMPTLEEVEAADQMQLGQWMRFLTTSSLDDIEIINRIVRRFTAGGGWTPGLSKAVGW